MPDPIKNQIMDRVLSTLQPLKTNGTLREISRGVDPLRTLRALPALMVTDGLEKTYAKTATAWQCRFPLELRIIFARARDAAAKRDELAAEVEKTLEADSTLGGLGTILDAGNEDPAPGADSDPTHETILRYTIQYTRKIADPYLSS
jgi:hypothetical protein